MPCGFGVFAISDTSTSFTMRRGGLERALAPSWSSSTRQRAEGRMHGYSRRRYHPSVLRGLEQTRPRSRDRGVTGVWDLQRHHLVSCSGFLGKDFWCDELGILALEIHIGNPTGYRALPSDEDRHSLSDHCCQHVL